MLDLAYSLKRFFPLITLMLFSLVAGAQQFPVRLAGKVLDGRLKPIEFATVGLAELNQVAYTDADGNFSITGNFSGSNLHLKISFVGKKSIDTVLLRLADNRQLQFLMQDLSLSLSEIQVTANRRQSEISNSSIIFDREAIEQVQAFSLTDIINTLPGKPMAAPDLQSPKSITLRSEATGVAAVNNSFGIALIVDGMRLSNDGNMQNTNVGSAVGGMLGSRITNAKVSPNTAFDVPFTGLDLRDIPADNIESIEVVSGVASARYSEITDGAVIINRQAGKAPFQFKARFNGSSSNFSLSKGSSLGRKLGAINFSVNYLNSNNDPRDKLKSYSRYGGSLIWTNYLARSVKNTLTIDVNYRKDNGRPDPDDGTQRSLFAETVGVGISNRTAITLNNKVLPQLNLSAGYSISTQETYSQFWINGSPKPVGGKDTTGIYEGYYIPGTYMAVEHVKGRPVSGNANLDLPFNTLYTGKFRHAVTMGAGFSLSGNHGEGVIADPNRPRLSNVGSKNERPYSYNKLPDMLNTGVYVQDRISFDFLHRNAVVNAGVRYDIQNGWGTIQPRINANYQLDDHWQLNMAYGISTKAPGMAHRYPGPTFYDIPLLQLYAMNARESLYLLYTQKIIHDNSYLKPSRSGQAEAGVRYSKAGLNTSLFAWYKNNRDGFSSSSSFRQFDLPVYGYDYTPGQKPVYYQTGATKTFAGLSDNVIGNNVSSDNYGLEWLISTGKIKAIKTGFTMSTAFAHSHYAEKGYRMEAASDIHFEDRNNAWYGVYPGIDYKNWSLITKISADTHIPKLGFVISVMADIYWQKIHRTLASSNIPFAYIDGNNVYHEIPQFDETNPVYGYLAIKSDQDAEVSQPFTYTNISMRIAKEIKKNIRFSVNAFNVLNMRARYYNPLTNTLTEFNSPVSIGAELSLKF